MSEETVIPINNENPNCHSFVKSYYHGSPNGLLSSRCSRKAYFLLNGEPLCGTHVEVKLFGKAMKGNHDNQNS